MQAVFSRRVIKPEYLTVNELLFLTIVPLTDRPEITDYPAEYLAGASALGAFKVFTMDIAVRGAYTERG